MSLRLSPNRAIPRPIPELRILTVGSGPTMCRKRSQLELFKLLYAFVVGFGPFVLACLLVAGWVLVIMLFWLLELLLTFSTPIGFIREPTIRIRYYFWQRTAGNLLRVDRPVYFIPVLVVVRRPIAEPIQRRQHMYQIFGILMSAVDFCHCLVVLHL